MIALGHEELVERHRARNHLDLCEAHITGLIQFFVIKAGLTKRVAARRHKQDDGAQALFALCGA